MASEILRPDEDSIVTTNTTYTVVGFSNGYEALADDDLNTYVHDFTENAGGSGVALAAFGFPAPSLSGPFIQLVLEIICGNSGGQLSDALWNNIDQGVRPATNLDQLGSYSIPNGALQTVTATFNGSWTVDDLDDVFFRTVMPVASDVFLYSLKLTLTEDPTIGYDTVEITPQHVLLPLRRPIYPYY